MSELPDCRREELLTELRCIKEQLGIIIKLLRKEPVIVSADVIRRPVFGEKTVASKEDPS